MFPTNILGIGENPDFRVWYSRKRERTMYDPNGAMRIVHADLIAWLKGLNIQLPHAHAFAEGRSTSTNAAVHQRGRFFYITDLRDAYGTLRPDMMARVLVGSSRELTPAHLAQVTTHLAKYFFIPNGGLYTGGPASPLLFNIYCASRLDKPLAKYCNAHGLKYSRYADDLAFSSATEKIGASKRDQIRRIIREAGFEPHAGKTRINLDLSKAPILIAGVLLHWEGSEQPARTTASRAQRKRAKDAVYAALEGKASSFVGQGHAAAVEAVTSGRESPEMTNLRVDHALLNLQTRRRS